MAKAHTVRADDNTAAIKQLNRSIFRPTFIINKEAKRAAQEAKILARSEEERDERTAVAKRIQATYGNLGKGGEADSDGPPRMREAEREQRKRYQFENTASDDEIEDEMADNLAEIGLVAKRLQGLGKAMGEELDHQNQWIDKIEGQTVRLDDRLGLATARVCCSSKSIPMF